MSEPVPRLADPKGDNAALCDLARRCPQGQHFRFYHQRDNYWQRCRLHRDSQVLVIERNGMPEATATFARKTVWLGGAFRKAVYIFDVMVDPLQRGQGLARRLLDSMFQRNADADLIYCYILADNQSSRGLFEKAGFRSCPQLLLYHPVLPALEGRHPPSNFRQICSAEEMDRIDAMLRQHWDFLDVTAGHDAVFSLEHDGVQAWAALRKHEPQVFVGLPWYAALVGRILPIVPAPGKPVTVWSLHHMGWQGSAAAGPRTLRRLIRSIAWLAARSHINALVLPLFANDPLTSVVRPLTLTRWGMPPGRVHLYAAGPLASLLWQSSRPLVLSGQDG